MKKLIPMVLFCTLLLSMLCLSAAAESTSESVIPEAVPFADQIENLWSEVGAAYPFDELEANHPLTGRWLPGVVEVLATGEKYESAGLFDFTCTLNEDGTVTMETPDGSADNFIGKMYFEQSLQIELFDPETGMKEMALQVISYDASHRYSDCNTLLLYIDGYWIYFFHEDYYEGFTVAEEPSPETLTPVTSLADISDISKLWELAYGISNGREICFQDYPVLKVQGDSFLTTILPDDNETGEGAFLVASYSYGPYMMIGIEEFVSDGIAKGVVVFNDSEAPVQLRLHGEGEDELLVMEWDELTYVFRVMTIDPLTEYTDASIVKEVQTAMNAEGYECGTADGISGKKTVAAISAYQADNGLTETGTVTEELLQSLRDKGYDL